MTASNAPSAASSSIPVLIAGAGPTGLVLALWLTTLGVAVRIIDTASGPGTTSRALAVQSHTLEMYQQLGIAQDVVNEGVRVEGVSLWANGARAASLMFGNLGRGLSPFDYMCVFPQDAHERMLVRHLEDAGVQVERLTELLSFEQRERDVVARIKLADGSEESCTARYIAGCDGAHSVVRRGIRSEFPGDTYSALFYVADLTATGKQEHNQVHVDLDQADFLAIFPLKGADRIRIVGSVAAEGDKPRENVTFEDVDARIIRNFGLQISKVNWFSSYRVHHRVASRFRDGRAFLLGDSAHIHSPVGGQGMNTGIGDAINLAWKLAAVVNGGAAESLLDSYEPERIAFARKLVQTTDRVFTVVTKRGPIAQFARTRLFPTIAPLLVRFAFVKSFLFHTVSQIGIEYRQSPLSSGAAGKLKGGDRLPWVRTSKDDDNFAPLASMSWQAHSYGASPEDITRLCTKVSLPLHVFEWSDATSRAGFVRGALYVVRPDGYIALIDPKPDPDRLAKYFESRGLAPSNVTRAKGSPLG